MSTREIAKKMIGLGLREGYDKWFAFIQELQDPQEIEEHCEEFCKYYPLNYSIWNKWIEQVYQFEGKSSALLIYEKALSLNPSCLKLWQNYLSLVQAEGESQNVIKQSLLSAANVIGRDVNSQGIWVKLLSMSNDFESIYKETKKMVSLPVRLIEHYYTQFKDMMNEQVEDQELKDTYYRVFNLNELFHKKTIQEMRDHFTYELDSSYKLNIQLLKDKIYFEDLLTQIEYDGANKDYETWLNYLEYEFQMGTKDAVIFLYQKALCSQWDKKQIWYDYFQMLSIHPVLKQTPPEIMKTYQYIVDQLGVDIDYFLSDHYEEFEGEKGLKKCLSLVETNDCLKSRVRYLQMQRRHLPLEQIEQIYKKLMDHYQGNPENLELVYTYYLYYVLENRPSQSITTLRNLNKTMVSIGVLSQFLIQHAVKSRKLDKYPEIILDVIMEAIYLCELQGNTKIIPDMIRMAKNHFRTYFLKIEKIRHAEHKLRKYERKYNLVNY